ncbi:type II toxin-antitoxin system HicA family toxin [Pseudonocardia hispaniensis]|uniref:Type II toxin-antitoxin system HicA family toxin n=1 Tax=Pseudonocardia hispaniensis TaxID=904933 RepID=A0ABW1IWU2_9PSEU
MKPMPTKDLRKLLRAKGCVEGGGKGSHEKWTAPGGHSTTLKASAKDQAPGTLRKIQEALAPEFGDRWIEETQ